MGEHASDDRVPFGRRDHRRQLVDDPCPVWVGSHPTTGTDPVYASHNLGLRPSTFPPRSPGITACWRPGTGRRYITQLVVARGRHPGCWSACAGTFELGPDERLGSFTHREEGQLEPEMKALDNTLLEKVERLVDDSRQPLRWTSSTTVVIAQLVERIEALEAALREIADAVTAAGATDAEHAIERRSSDY